MLSTWRVVVSYSVFCAGNSGSSGSGRPRPRGLRKLQAAPSTTTQQSESAATAAAAHASAAAPATASTTAAATVAATEVAAGSLVQDLTAIAQRQLLQEHVCYGGDYWIQCNSQPLCWGIGRGAPSTGKSDTDAGITSCMQPLDCVALPHVLYSIPGSCLVKLWLSAHQQKYTLHQHQRTQTTASSSLIFTE
jgi:hypothetical protein